MDLDTGCGKYYVLGSITSNVFLLDDNRTGLFNFHKNMSNRYLNGDRGYLASKLKELLGGTWEMYSVFLEDHPMSVPAHYILRLGNSDLYMDIIGIRHERDIINEWIKYAAQNDALLNPNDSIISVTIKKTGDNMDNKDFDCDIPYKDTRYVLKEILTILNKRFRILKIITANNHPFATLKSFRQIYKTDKQLLHRVACNYKLLASIGVGPKVETFLCNDVLVVIMEYLPISSSNKINEENAIQIKELISKIHDLGIIHGDLHGSNIAYDDTMRPYLIDADTMFFKQETKNNSIFAEWIDDGFGMTLDEYKAHESNVGWKGCMD
jgi:serine/threonine protein kinase